MDPKIKKQLEDRGRFDLIEIFEINQSGYAGILSNGNIVSRLQYPEAIPIQENKVLCIPPVKKLKKEMSTDYVCVDCGKYFLTEAQLKEGGGVSTFHKGVCGICEQEKSITHIRHYNYLNHFKYNRKDGRTKVHIK